MESKYSCDFCGNHIEYDDAAAGGSLISCPHCNKEIVLPASPPTYQELRYYAWIDNAEHGPFDVSALVRMSAEGKLGHDTLIRPEDGSLEWTFAQELIPTAGFAEPPVLQDEELIEVPIDNILSFFFRRVTGQDFHLRLRLVSGAELNVTAIRLYNEYDLALIAAKRAAAAQKHQGVSTGLGAIGSLGWVLAASVVIGAVEGALSDSAAHEGDKLLVESMELEENIRKQIYFFPVTAIENIQSPTPGLWKVLGTKRKKNDKSLNSTAPAAVFIVNNDDFITIETADGATRAVRWKSVEDYSLIPIENTSSHLK